MGVRKLPGIVIMKYEYEIKNDSVTEFEDELYNGNWSFNTLKRNNNDFIMTDYEVISSFNRTREWVLENCVEMLL
jgi:hypothetical protein